MDFEFTPSPKMERMSPAAFAAVSDDVLEDALVGYVVDHMLGEGEGLEAIAGWPPALQTWYVAFTVDAEVLNGGFNQFFFNSSGSLAPAAVEAFAQIGVPEAGELVARALTLLERHAPALEAAHEADSVEAFMETYIDQPFSELDNAYDARHEDLRVARIRFIRDHVAALSHP